MIVRIVLIIPCAMKISTNKSLPALRRSLLRRNLPKRRQTFRPPKNRPKRSSHDSRNAPSLRHRQNPDDLHRQIPLVSLDWLAADDTRLRTPYSPRLRHQDRSLGDFVDYRGCRARVSSGPGFFAAQATCSQDNAAVATSVYSFLRSFGMCLGVATGRGKMFQNVLKDWLADDRLPRWIAMDATAYAQKLRDMQDTGKKPVMR